MSKHINLDFSHWELRYNGIVPTGNSDYSAKHEYIAEIVYRGMHPNKKEHIQDKERKTFDNLEEAIEWLKSNSGGSNNG